MRVSRNMFPAMVLYSARSQKGRGKGLPYDSLISNTFLFDVEICHVSNSVADCCVTCSTKLATHVAEHLKREQVLASSESLRSKIADAVIYEQSAKGAICGCSLVDVFGKMGCNCVAGFPPYLESIDSIVLQAWNKKFVGKNPQVCQSGDMFANIVRDLAGLLDVPSVEPLKNGLVSNASLSWTFFLKYVSRVIFPWYTFEEESFSCDIHLR
jgi:hypothetical protein